METSWNNIELMAKEIRETLTDFMLNHSSIEPPRYEEVAAYTPEGDRSYAFLDKEGREIQSALSERYSRFSSTVNKVIQDQSDDVLEKMCKSEKVLTRTIEHRITWCKNTKQALDLALSALEEQLSMVKAACEGEGRKG